MQNTGGGKAAKSCYFPTLISALRRRTESAGVALWLDPATLPLRFVTYSEKKKNPLSNTFLFFSVVVLFGSKLLHN